MKTHFHGALSAGPKTFAHRARPDSSRRPILGDLFKKIVMSVEEERNPWRELLEIETRADTPFNVFNPIAECKRQLLQGCGACFANVITANRNRVIARNMIGAKLESINNQFHRGADWIDPLLLGYILFQDVVL